MKLTVTKAEKMNAELFGTNYNKYKTPGMVDHKDEGIKLFIKGILEDGTPVSFYSPTTIVTTASGMLNYKHIKGETGWFAIEKGEMEGIKNALYYEGSTDMPVAIYSKDVVKQLVNVGDEIEITFKVKGSIGKEKRLWYVKIKK